MTFLNVALEVHILFTRYKRIIFCKPETERPNLLRDPFRLHKGYTTIYRCRRRRRRRFERLSAVVGLVRAIVVALHAVWRLTYRIITCTIALCFTADFITLLRKTYVLSLVNGVTEISMTK